MERFALLLRGLVLSSVCAMQMQGMIFSWDVVISATDSAVVFQLRLVVANGRLQSPCWRVPWESCGEVERLQRRQRRVQRRPDGRRRYGPDGLVREPCRSLSKDPELRLVAFCTFGTAPPRLVGIRGILDDDSLRLDVDNMT